MTRHDTKHGRYYEIDGRFYPSVTTILQVIHKPFLIQWAAKLERELCLTVTEQVLEEYFGGQHPDAYGDSHALSDLMRGRLGHVRAHERAKEKASDIGNDLHALIEHELRTRLGQASTPPPLACEEAQLAFRTWQLWAEEVDLVPLQVETVVHSQRDGYAGTMDTLASLIDTRVGHRLTAQIDWKSSKAIYKEYLLQSAAYGAAWAEMTEGSAPHGLIVRLPKSGHDPLLQTLRPFEPVWVPPVSDLLPVFRAAHTLWQWQIHDWPLGGTPDGERTLREPTTPHTLFAQ